MITAKEFFLIQHRDDYENLSREQLIDQLNKRDFKLNELKLISDEISNLLDILIELQKR